VAQKLPVPALQRSAARIIGISARGRLVVSADHLKGLLCFQIVKCQVNRTAAIMARAARRISYKDFFVVRRGVPKNFSYVPWAISVMNQQAIAVLLQFLIGADDGFGGGALHKSARL